MNTSKSVFVEHVFFVQRTLVERCSRLSHLDHFFCTGVTFLSRPFLRERKVSSKRFFSHLHRFLWEQKVARKVIVCIYSEQPSSWMLLDGSKKFLF